MKTVGTKSRLILGFEVLLLSLGIAATCQADYPNSISVQQAKALVDGDKALLVDVREQSEVAQGMAAPATWYAKSAIDADLKSFVSFLKKSPDKKYIIYCRSGHRASVVVDKLNKEGIDSFNMGGYQAWVDAGFPTRKQ